MVLKTRLLTLLVAPTTVAHSDLVVQLSPGRVRGAECTNSNTTHFQGIPFAEPPVGNLRFMPPQPFKGHFTGGILDATTAPPPCIQMPSNFDVENPTASEDCLYLDVYVPPGVSQKSDLPVKVFGYGGSNIGGALSYPLYDACNLATDAVVVVFNYRLGPLGFLGLASAGIQGNMAIQDYLAALEWVNLNICNFGGDNSKVVLFGQSAGGDDTFTVSTLPQAKSLISAAVMESGGGQDMTPYETAQYSGASYARALNCNRTDLKCLQSKPVEQLIAAYENTPALLDMAESGGELTLAFGIQKPNVTSLASAIIDGKIIQHEPLKVGSQVPVIAGMAEQDSRLFVIPFFLAGNTDISEENYATFLDEWGPVGPAIAQQYPLSLFNSSGSTTDAVVAAISHIVTTASFQCTTYRALRAATAAGTPAYAYRFNHTRSCPWLWEDGQAFPGPELANKFGPTHTAELPFVFANLENQPWGNGTCNATASERKLSHELTSAWTAIATKGNPSTRSQFWPRFDECENKGVYIQDKLAVSSLDFSECEFWDGIWAELGSVRFSWPSSL